MAVYLPQQVCEYTHYDDQYLGKLNQNLKMFRLNAEKIIQRVKKVEYLLMFALRAAHLCNKEKHEFIDTGEQVHDNTQEVRKYTMHIHT